MTKVLALPFLAPPHRALDKLLRSLAEDHPYLPADFLDNWPNSDRTYVPAYVFRVRWKVNWTAEFGNHRQEHYTTWNTHPLHTGHHKPAPTPVNNTKTVTDWRFGGGRDVGSATYVAYAGNGQLRSIAEVVATSRPEGANLVELSSVELTEPFYLTEDDAWNNDVRSRASETIGQSIRKYEQGDESRNWAWSGDIEKDVRHLICPIELYKLEYGGLLYYFPVNLYTLEMKHNYRMPIDRSALIRSMLFYIAPLISMLFAFGFFEQNETSSVWVSLAGAAVLGLVARSFQVSYRYRKTRGLLERFNSLRPG